MRVKHRRTNRTRYIYSEPGKTLKTVAFPITLKLNLIYYDIKPKFNLKLIYILSDNIKFIKMCKSTHGDPSRTVRQKEVVYI